MTRYWTQQKHLVAAPMAQVAVCLPGLTGSDRDERFAPRSGSPEATRLISRKLGNPEEGL